MKMNSSHLETFYIVSQVKNFSKASEIMYLSQPAITQRIKQLETQLECQLFTRNNNGIELTEAGQKLIIYYLKQKQTEDEIIQNIKNQKDEIYGRYSIVCGSAMVRDVNLQAVTTITKMYPNIDISLTINDDDITEPTKLLRTGQYDAIITQNKIDNKYVISSEITEIDLFLVINGKANISDKPTKEELLNYRAIDTSPLDQLTINHLDKCYKNESFSELKRYYINSTRGILDWILLGEGFSALPEPMIISKVKDKSLKCLFPDISTKHSLYLATLENNSNTINELFYNILQENWSKVKNKFKMS